MKLSKNFSLAEMTKSQTATRMGLNNNPTDDQTENLRLLCERVLQPVRDHFNQVVTISSGFRDPILSNAIGSSTKSHLKCLSLAGQVTFIQPLRSPNLSRC